MPRVVNRQMFTVLPSGATQEGHFFYTVDPHNGEIHYQGEIKVRKYYIPFTKQFSGTAFVKPELLVSSRRVMGENIKIGNLTIMITTIANRRAYCLVSVEGFVAARGNAVLDLTGSTIAIESLDATAMALGLSIPLVIREQV